MVDVIETVFWQIGCLPGKWKAGRPAVLATAEKIHVPGVDFPEKGNIMVHIEQAEPLKQLIPNTAVSGALSFLREKTER